MNELLDRFMAGDIRAASRLMSMVERGGEDAERVIDALYPRTGRAYRVAITGPTGSGKSTLIGVLVRRLREAGQTVGVVAEDPSSPFTGGAVLGDRIRMHGASGDDGLFIRSVASRGAQSGFSAIAGTLADVLDAFGRDVVVMETTGVGQLEFRVRFDADTIVVVFTPESGDEVQSLKSGLVEIGDVFVVNKSDRPGAKRFARDMEASLDLRTRGDGWVPPVVLASARKTDDDGTVALSRAVDDHRRYLAADGRLDALRESRLRDRVRALATDRLVAELWGNAYSEGSFGAIFEAVASRRLSPSRAARELAEAICGRDSE